MRIEDTTELIDAVHDDLSKSSFHDVNLDNSAFSNSSLVNATFDSMSFNGAKLTNVTCLGMKISYADLTNVSIAESNTTGMTIDGISVNSMIELYRNQGPQ